MVGQTEFAPELSQRRAPVGIPPGAMLVKNVGSGSLYESGSLATRRSVGWNAPTASANQGVLSNLTTLRDRSRATTRNDGYGKSVIDKLVTECIGTGIKPLSQAPMDVLAKHPVSGKQVPLRHAIQALWTLWTDECDADGRCDFYGLEKVVTQATLEGGEAFSRLRFRRASDGLSVPLQLQVLEPELCPHTYNMFGSNTRIRAGIEFNPIGQRIAYWFHPSRIEFDDYDRSQLRQIDASSVQHVYDLLRPGQLRGIPHLTQVLILLRELAKFADATTMRQQLSNMFVAFIKKQPGIGDDETVHPLTGETVDQDAEGTPMIGMEPGITQELLPGEEMQFSNPPGANGFQDFMRQQLLAVASGANVPYEVITGDMRGVNDRTVRILLNMFRRRIQMWQHQVIVFLFCRPVWSAWMDRVNLSGALELPADYLDNPAKYQAVKWIPQGWPYMHPVQDVQAQQQAVRAGFTTRTAVVSEQGEDAEVIDVEQSNDNTRADDLELRYDSDGRNAINGPPSPAPQGDAGGDQSGEPASTGAAA